MQISEIKFLPTKSGLKKKTQQLKANRMLLLELKELN